MKLDFWVTGKPECLGHRSAHLKYTPREVQDWRDLIRAAAIDAAGGQLDPYPGKVALSIEAYGTPADVDNIAKGVLDALNRHAFHDDCQVVQLIVLAADRELAAGGRPKRPKGYQGVHVMLEAM